MLCVALFYLRILSLSQSNFGQYLDLYHQNTSSISPSITDTNHLYNFSLNNRSQSGLFEGINQLYANLDLRVASKSTFIHNAGFSIQNTTEGEFIDRNRAYIKYSIFKRIASRTSISGGASLGAINYIFENSNGGSGGSDTKFDLNLGVNILFRDLTAGVALQQATQPTLQPINARIEHPLFYNSFLMYNFHINQFTKLEVSGLLQMTSEELKYSLSGLLVLNNSLDVGVAIRKMKGFVFFAGIHEIAILNQLIYLHLAYQSTYAKYSLQDNALEILIGLKK